LFRGGEALVHLLYIWLLSLVELVYLAWHCPDFLPVQWRLWGASWGDSPYLAPQRYPERLHKEVGSEELIYGEISLVSLDRVLRSLGIGKDDQFVDLGCGRGRLVLFAAARGIPSRGIDVVENLLQRGREAAAGLSLPASLEQGLMQEADLSEATVFFIAGTCLREETRQQVAQRLGSLAQNAWVLSLSAPLTHPSLPIKERIPAWTTWGRDVLYLQRVSRGESFS